MSLAGSSSSNTQAQAPPAEQPPPVEQVLQEIVSNPGAAALSKLLKSYPSKDKDVRDNALREWALEGQDPLSVLDPETNTVGFVYLLAARSEPRSSRKPALVDIERFCARFNPEHARLAPERRAYLLIWDPRRRTDRHKVMTFATCLSTSWDPNPHLLLGPLFDLVTKYPPTPSHLTALHPAFLRLCVRTQHYSAALPVLSEPILHIETSISPLIYNDNLIYHYAGGCALGALKKWREAEEFFEICASAPGQAAAAIQLEALKKLTLVQLILYGKAIPPPKYTHPTLVRLSKNSPYGNLARMYPAPSAELQAFVAKNSEVFRLDQNAGLVQQVVARAPRWLIKKLTSTYLTLNLSDIAKQVQSNTEQIRSTIVSMIDTGEVNASISLDDTVTFSDTVTRFTKEDVESALAEAQEQAKLLFKLEREMQLNKEYLAKALKHKDEGSSGFDDEVGFSSWAEESMFG